ncbi:hypothetical protein C9374_002508 [Naegleria lovaniensis]|uniref:F-box/LRR-repeat protein 15-like leucin rich repeat domain-containing protein n=1 Tax=Naegleria lovaniensis TaxID=51637 RepID=A0AA88GW14_NAELO|nr:uncharacterized protein C9374_002508 [Naegleria lovaniensis]KAG2386764.1 hypothetical protein C9374_002508 [Naegleria lovaniensis]
MKRWKRLLFGYRDGNNNNSGSRLGGTLVNGEATSSSKDMIFPSEILYLIFQFVDSYQDILISFKGVCKYWYRVATKVPLAMTLSKNTLASKSTTSHPILMHTNITSVEIVSGGVGMSMEEMKIMIKKLKSVEDPEIEKQVIKYCGNEMKRDENLSIWRKLLEFKFGANRIGDVGVKLLMTEAFGSFATPRRSVLSNVSYCLQVLSLNANDIQLEGVKAIAGNPSMKNLSYLNLWWNRIDNECLQVITSSENLQNLTELHIGSCQFDAIGVKYIAESSFMKKLTVLDLTCNEIGKEGVKYLSQQGTSLQNLTSLSLNNCLIEDEGLEFLMDGYCIQNMTKLELMENMILKGLNYLASKKQPFKKYLIVLKIGANKVGDEGVKVLAGASNEQLHKLERLNLIFTDISDVSVEVIVNCERWKGTLRRVDVTKNGNVTTNGLELLRLHGINIRK